MGKKQHQKDKLYLTTKEWKETYGGHKDDTDTRVQRSVFKRLPFNHCALSFLPFEDPVCTSDGVIFDLTRIVPYIRKHGINPVTGKKLSVPDLITLHFDKDAEGNYRCPVTFRTFTESSNIVAIRQTGNVYAKEAVEELNLKTGHLKDLLTDEPFQRKDIIVLQDPNHLEKFNIEKFYHVTIDLKTKSEIEAEKKAMQDPKFYIRSMNNEMKEALSRLEKEYVPAKRTEIVEEDADIINAAHYSQGKVSASFTSTAMDPVTHQKAAVLSAATVRYSRVTKNGYIRIITNYGALNLELYCKLAPKACENFITHCKQKYYDGTKFHRLIRNFMIQGGDPTGTGKGGDSIWGKPFEDEFVKSLSHDQRGVLSMANRGTDTNLSQFFITFRPCKYLDGKHTIFGRVVGGTDVLTVIEKLPTEAGTDRPKDDIIFLTSEVYVDPFEEAEAIVQKERDALSKASDSGSHTGAPSSQATSELPKPKAYGSGVGKYLDLSKYENLNKRVAVNTTNGSKASPEKPKKIARTQLNDFSAW
ncbi:hypothetical protein AB6A40_001850 [Gnathostoma spinigerum]|uniref:RING-type E3 ubiquitin-protein ligase PPIL2 n=1 Tax=Gnathostoma spinigerum TaxID=75299 RepID=A0ABD6E6F0_9BILA